ncbi:translation elongation factor Ts [Halanaerobacter jeridensis]|uniref:Elongation factor Ts n=1 Tax=Halanaerobacter jeridensis TaxID=706427 RepID=A0A938XQC5_9FIRM|nr:translation elongation factor Ts [Halanaerobacter jeridensis]MBM7555370.1 elongation factor Ts [Halanaerobacter jeridensis]
MGISTADIKKLRERTSAGMLDCKEALTETDGDLEAAVDYLREKGMSSADKSDRVAAEGLVSVEKEDDTAVIVEINSETDFVAKNDEFKEVVNDVTDHILMEQPDSVDAALEQALKGDGEKVDQYLKEAITQIGEKITLRRFEILDKNAEQTLATYLHMGGQIGVAVLLEDADEELAKNVAMHIAAANPDYLDRDSVSEEEVEKEKKILRKQAEKEDKPEHIIDKIVNGRLDKFYQNNCLLEQEYIRDTDLTIKELIAEQDAEIVKFVRYEVGEGIEVEEEDFAEEVMNEVNK